MYRFLSLKALGLALVGLVAMGAMIVLGLWQLSVYDGHQHDDAQAALREPVVPLESLLGPDEAFPSDGVSRPVTVTGSYLAGAQIYVLHLPGAKHRYAVATPLVTSTGSAVIVVRGSSDTPTAPAPTGPVTVTGVLEADVGTGGPPNAARVADGLSIASLVNAIHPDLYSGYVLLRSSAPSQSPALSPVVPPLPDPSRWAGIRNLLYACQWWIFALFVVFMWWHITADLETRRIEDTARSDSTSDALRTLG